MTIESLFNALDLSTQPDGLRDCHEQMLAWFLWFEHEKPNEVDGLSAPQKRRLGYLVSVWRMMGHKTVHPSWEAFESDQHRIATSLPSEPLWACDAVPNALDELATSWGLVRGVRISTLVTILEHGSF